MATKSVKPDRTKKKSPGKTSGTEKNKSKAALSGKTRRQELTLQLNKIIKELNEEGLMFMIKQGLVLKHNMQVDEINRGLEKAKDSVKTGGKKKPARKGADKHSIEIVEGADKSHFIFVINNYRNFFSLEEMRQIVAICHAATDVRDAAARLYVWFKRERIDVINNTGISGIGDPSLATMYNAVVSAYTVRE